LFSFDFASLIVEINFYFILLLLELRINPEDTMFQYPEKRFLENSGILIKLPVKT